MRYAVGDVHGHRRQVTQALHGAGLVDDRSDWCGETAEVWFVGDLLDRGPDGVGVIADVMRWQRQARDAGGSVESVLGNHEVLALGFRRFGDDLPGGGDPTSSPQSFLLSWLMNGGQQRDQELLTEEMVAWLSALPAMVRSGEDLILHADTLEYFRWGPDLEAVNQGIAAVLRGGDVEATWQLWAAMTSRYAYVEDNGPELARMVLNAVGARRIVHGHSIIGDLTDTPPEQVTGPLSYADGLVLDVDGGIYAGGPSLVVPLD